MRSLRAFWRRFSFDQRVHLLNICGSLARALVVHDHAARARRRAAFGMRCLSTACAGSDRRQSPDRDNELGQSSKSGGKPPHSRRFATTPPVLEDAERLECGASACSLHASQCNRASRAGGHDGPPHPCPLPEERETVRPPSLDSCILGVRSPFLFSDPDGGTGSRAARMARERTRLFPVPWGEGKGEGERDGRWSENIPFANMRVTMCSLRAVWRRFSFDQRVHLLNICGSLARTLAVHLLGSPERCTAAPAQRGDLRIRRHQRSTNGPFTLVAALPRCEKCGLSAFSAQHLKPLRSTGAVRDAGNRGSE